MYSLRLTCKAEEADLLSAELYEGGTVGIHELDDEDNRTILIAGFESNQRETLLTRFGNYLPEWTVEQAVDWVRVAQNSWPAREIGERLFVAPQWSERPTPCGRIRLVHNPALACGTGEHPCTRMALLALERSVFPGCGVVDVGTGSGMLAIATRLLGAATAFGLDVDCAALKIARGNFQLNDVQATLICGSAECTRTAVADIAVANISGSVLLAIWDDLVRITRPGGKLIVTGFTTSEAAAFRALLANCEELQSDDWSCLCATFS